MNQAQKVIIHRRAFGREYEGFIVPPRKSLRKGLVMVRVPEDNNRVWTISEDLIIRLKGTA